MASVIRIHKTGGPEVLQVDGVYIGAPGRGELRLRVHAFGLNRAEAMFRSGKYLEQPTLPGRLGYEAAGTAMIWRINMEPIAPSCRFTPMGLVGVQASFP